ncbi:hypothetical protein CHS0354_014646, partial [Potamilus streckersoni]
RTLKTTRRSCGQRGKALWTHHPAIRVTSLTPPKRLHFHCQLGGGGSGVRRNNNDDALDWMDG